MNNSERIAFEMSLRFLLLLDVTDAQSLSAGKLCSIDFICTYAADYGYSDTNLNGNGSYRFSEYPNRKILTSDALSILVTRGLVIISSSENGPHYKLSELGESAVKKLCSDYAENYWHTAYRVFQQVGTQSESQLNSLIQDQAMNHL